MYNLMRILLFAAALCLPAFSQTIDPSQTVDGVTKAITDPDFVAGGLSYDQYNGLKGFLTGVFIESHPLLLMFTATADIVASQQTDPKTGKTGYLLQPSLRFGQHRQLHWDGRNLVTIGGDIGPTWSQAPATSTGSSTPAGASISVGSTSVNLSGSFQITYARMLTPKWGFLVSPRMLWVAGAGPNGSGAWNPVLQAGFAYRVK
jgi:hypothetical protein